MGQWLLLSSSFSSNSQLLQETITCHLHTRFWGHLYQSVRQVIVVQPITNETQAMEPKVYHLATLAPSSSQLCLAPLWEELSHKVETHQC